jgi:hypothetical protein
MKFLIEQKFLRKDPNARKLLPTWAKTSSQMSTKTIDLLNIRMKVTNSFSPVIMHP